MQARKCAADSALKLALRTDQTKFVAGRNLQLVWTQRTLATLIFWLDSRQQHFCSKLSLGHHMLKHSRALRSLTRILEGPE